MKNQSFPVSFTKDHCILNKSQTPKFETGPEVGMENPTRNRINLLKTLLFY